MAPLYAHLGRDPKPHFIMRTQAPRVADYVERMNGFGTSRVAPVGVDETEELGLGLRGGSQWAGVTDSLAWRAGSSLRGGDWCADDAIPPTVISLLRRQFLEQLPVVRANSAELGRRLNAGVWPQDRALPGAIAGLSATPEDGGLGWFDALIYGVPTALAIRPNMTAMAQDLVDLYHGLSGPDRAAVDELVQEVGGAEAIALFRQSELLGGCPRLERRAFRLWWRSAA